MVRIRLSRIGRRNLPVWRIAVFDKRTRRDGRFLENLGVYYPKETDDQKKIVIKKERLIYWLGKGAQLTDTLKSLLKNAQVAVK